MDMKKFLQAVDGVSTKTVEGGNDMKKFLQVVSEVAAPPVAAPAQQSPEQIAYNQLRAQLDSADALRGGANTHTDVSPEVTASTNAMRSKLAQMAAALKAKGIDAEAEYNAPDPAAPAAAPVDLATKYVNEHAGMSRLLSIISEGKGPLNRPTAAESLTMQHYTTPRKTITSPVLNVAEGATPSMIGKYFKAVEQELVESEQRGKEASKLRATQLAERVTSKINGPKIVKEEFAEENPKDKVTMDIPLLMRVLEHAREDIKDDMALHNVVDRLIKLSESGETLTMDNYDAIVGDQMALPAPDENQDGEEDY